MKTAAAGWLFAGCLVASIIFSRADDSASAFVKTTIASNPLVIFSKSYCPYCKRAKNVFKELKETPYVVELDLRDDGGSIQEEIGKMHGVWTVPQVFIGGQRLGGSDDTVAAYSSGKLQKMLDDLKKSSGESENYDL
ncbi:hypothetical protein CBR_g18876 [Chara braunii]|uniref:Glutaredoxin domain-containing protein n=1 Tax=Chara braunii TaxID=69332 RepID=A0A388KWM3_CHABU|nr:hypothetical protein CBR_g18876 [Chara braunii]|eukprot:GBG74465.1 hypothetical protein CBR_g18876 [Chara braunii]